MDNNEELKQQIENINHTLDINKLLNLSESNIQEVQGNQQQQVKESPNSDDSAGSPIKGSEDLITQGNLVSILDMAKNLVNPSTLSLLSKLNNPIQKQEGNTELMIAIEQLSGELKKVHIELDQIKRILSAIRQ